MVAASASGQVATHQDVAVGLELRQFQFDSGVGARRVVQWAVPVVGTAQLGPRLTISIATSWSRTTLDAFAGWTDQFSGWGDAVLRAVYALGDGSATVSFTANLPTAQRPGAKDLPVVGAVASNFLSFPVTSFGQGLSTTGGLAVVRRVRRVYLSAGAAVRWSGQYQAIGDASLQLQPGIESRAYISADAPFAGGHLLATGTASTFSHDAVDLSIPDVASTSTTYQPGTKLLGEAEYARAVGAATVTAYLWEFLSAARRDTAGAVRGSREVIAGAGLCMAVMLGGAVTLTPAIRWRATSHEGTKDGQLVSADVSLSRSVGRFAGELRGGYDSGFIASEGGGQHIRTQGMEASAMLRVAR